MLGKYTQKDSKTSQAGSKIKTHPFSLPSPSLHFIPPLPVMFHCLCGTIVWRMGNSQSHLRKKDVFSSSNNQKDK